MSIGDTQVVGKHYVDMNGPVVNINGSTRSALIETHSRVVRDIRDLLINMRNTMPHGRDYQTAQAPVSYTHDRMVFEGMLQDLENVRKQYERILERLVMEEDSVR